MPELDKLIREQSRRVNVARQLWHASEGGSAENTRHAKYLAQVEELERLMSMKQEATEIA